MTYDAAVPSKLKDIQQWFASIITRPIDMDNRMQPVSPSGTPMEKEAWTYIAPSHTLQPAQRIELYNQQYWWRLLTTLQEDNPFLVRLFGYTDFNQTIAIPFLEAYPPNHWNLNFVSRRIPQWVSESYQAPDKKLVLNAALIDHAYSNSFFAAHRPPINLDTLPVKGDISSLLDHTIYLQPHIYLFQLDRDLFSFRREFLKQEPDYWIDNNFPEMIKGREFYFVLYRNLQNNITWREVGEAEFGMLSQFKNGTTVERACQWLEQQDHLLEEAEKGLPKWFKEWTISQWLTLAS